MDNLIIVPAMAGIYPCVNDKRIDHLVKRIMFEKDHIGAKLMASAQEPSQKTARALASKMGIEAYYAPILDCEAEERSYRQITDFLNNIDRTILLSAILVGDQPLMEGFADYYWKNVTGLKSGVRRIGEGHAAWIEKQDRSYEISLI